MKTLTLEFYECEHGGDLNNYMEDIIECGGKIIDSDIDYEAEIGEVVVEVEDEKAFNKLFEETDSYDFLN
jgi:hypothetical protein